MLLLLIIYLRYRYRLRMLHPSQNTEIYLFGDPA